MLCGQAALRGHGGPRRRATRENAALATPVAPRQNAVVDGQQCIFCRRNFDEARPRSNEHIVPKAAGGWLTTELVCKECNDFFGHQVDNIVDEPLLKAMRVEADLATKDILDGVYFDPEFGEVPGYLHEDGSFEGLFQERRRLCGYRAHAGAGPASGR